MTPIGLGTAPPASPVPRGRMAESTRLEGTRAGWVAPHGGCWHASGTHPPMHPPYVRPPARLNVCVGPQAVIRNPEPGAVDDGVRTSRELASISLPIATSDIAAAPASALNDSLRASMCNPSRSMAVLAIAPRVTKGGAPLPLPAPPLSAPPTWHSLLLLCLLRSTLRLPRSKVTCFADT